MRDFKKLAVWEKAHLLTVAVYKVTTAFPKEEIYGLTSQIRRAAASIPANIAEGCGREGDAEFGRFLKIAAGSASELKYQFMLARELEFLNSIDYKILDNQVDEVMKMLTALTQKTKS